VGLELVSEVSRSHSDTPHSIRLLERVIDPSQGPQTNKIYHSQDTDIHIHAGIRNRSSRKGGPQTHALDRAATEISLIRYT